jgi:cobalt/nickel transport system permease protein
MSGLVAVPWAVHIADGILSGRCLAAGWAGAGLLVLGALLGLVFLSWRGQELETEVPRIALLTAAFFVASSIHLKLGPTSVHLLLNGLVGVMLGWRAPVAILIGVSLQVVLLAHGGFTTIGINTCVQAIPALLVGGLFGLVQRVPWRRHRLARGLIVAGSVGLWGLALVFGAVILWTNPLRDLLVVREGAGLVLSADNLTPAFRVTFHPLTLGLLSLAALAGAVLEGRLENAPEFPLGLLIGILAVLLTTALVGVVLLLDGRERWSNFVAFVFLAHLPLAIVEGLVLGCTVGFLARVKPELIGLRPAPADLAVAAASRAAAEEVGRAEADLPSGGATAGVAAASRAAALVGPGTRRVAADLPPPCPAEATPEEAITTASPAPVSSIRPLGLLGLLGLLFFASPVQAHRLEAECEVDSVRQIVKVESWFETGDAPKNATARVLRADGSLLVEGSLNAKGVFTFTYDRAEPLTVEVLAPGGHRAEVKVPAERLETHTGETEATRPVLRSGSERGGGSEGSSRSRDMLTGVSFILALSAFVLSLWNSYRIRGGSRSAETSPTPGE